MSITNFTQYQRAVIRTAPPKEIFKDALNIAALGITGEGGELANKIKKMLYHGHDLDPEELLEEIGDVLWYLAFLAETLDTDLCEIANANIEKLYRRYPDGFSYEASRERVE